MVVVFSVLRAIIQSNPANPYVTRPQDTHGPVLLPFLPLEKSIGAYDPLRTTALKVLEYPDLAGRNP
jgi:hypothetical protein